MKLNASIAYRDSKSGNKRPVSMVVEPAPGLADRHDLVFQFDIGSSDKHELVELKVDPLDFEAVIGGMMTIDREKVIRAFAAAVLVSEAQ